MGGGTGWDCRCGWDKGCGIWYFWEERGGVGWWVSCLVDSISRFDGEDFDSGLLGFYIQ